MRVIIQSYSTIGMRPQNEDAMEVINNLDNANKSLIPILYASIFDGHGGGHISKTLIDKDKINISGYFCHIKSPVASKIQQVKTFNNKIVVPLFTRIQEKLKNYCIESNKMGSTALISIVYPRCDSNRYCLKIINLGDSRAILCNSYNISQQLTLDHKPHLYCEKKRILNMGGSLEESEGDDIRINGMSVSRSFGDLDNKYISQKPDVFDYYVSDEKFIIMGCDGVWDVLGNQEAVDFVLERYDEIIKNKKLPPNLKAKSEFNIAQKLAEYAINKGSSDNISLIILFFIDNML